MYNKKEEIKQINRHVYSINEDTITWTSKILTWNKGWVYPSRFGSDAYVEINPNDALKEINKDCQ